MAKQILGMEAPGLEDLASKQGLKSGMKFGSVVAAGLLIGVPAVAIGLAGGAAILTGGKKLMAGVTGTASGVLNLGEGL